MKCRICKIKTELTYICDKCHPTDKDECKKMADYINETNNCELDQVHSCDICCKIKNYWGETERCLECETQVCSDCWNKLTKMCNKCYDDLSCDEE